MPTVTLTTEDAVTLPGMGIVTGSLTYSPGCAATWDQPGDEAEIETVYLKDAFGTDLDPDMILEHPARYAALEQAVGTIEAARDAADYAAYAAELDSHPDYNWW